MARKEAMVTIAADGRDKGKVFYIREMDADRAEALAVRAFFALAKAEVQVPDEVVAGGLAGVASMGLNVLARLNYADAEPLAQELMACIQIVPDPARPEVRRPLIRDDIEEVRTRLFLKGQVFELHTGFSVAAALSSSAQATAQSSQPSNTKTSRVRSAR